MESVKMFVEQDSIDTVYFKELCKLENCFSTRTDDYFNA